MLTIASMSLERQGMNLLFVCILAALSAASSVIHKRPPGLPPMLLGRPAGGIQRTAFHAYNNDETVARVVRDDPYPWLVRGVFSQKYDHFNPLDSQRWQQRFWYNPKYYNPSSSDGRDVVFLHIGGEGPESDRWAAEEGYMYLQWAKKFGAAVFSLEHRFFGESWPIKDLSVSSLRLLSTQQALEDLAFFVLSMNKQHNFRNPKWITFGGSYPGALSAAFRSKYPELTVGAVASSAPLNQKLDFFEYAQVVEAVVTNTSAACARSITEAFAKMQQLATTRDGRQTLNRVFNLAPPFDEKTTKADVSNFFANIYNLFQGMIQYTYDGRNEDSKSNLTAKKLCDIMTSSDAVVDNVYKLYNWYSIFYPPTNENITQFANSYADTINALKETNVSKMSEDTAAYRGWFWMACNEFGYMQTTDGGRGMFGSTIPINYFFDMCTDAFGSEFKAERIRDGNRAAMRFYGGQFFFKATNLLLPNGMYDPWSALGYYPNQDQAAQNVFAVKIEGAAHCSDMYPPYDGEPTSLTAARAFIESKLRAFLTEPEPAAPTTSQSPGSSTSWMSTASPQTNSPTAETRTETTTNSASTHGVLIVFPILPATILAMLF